MSDVADLPNDIEALKAIVRDMSAQVVARDAEIARHEAQLRHHALMIAKLKARLSKQLRDRFGSSAESLEQLQLMLEDLEISHNAEAPASEPAPEPAQKDKPARKPLPDHLPRSEKVLEAGNACSDCGGKLKRVGEDVTEELEYIPGRFVVNRFIRPRMACVRRHDKLTP